MMLQLNHLKLETMTTPVETIGQFVSNLETKFDPDEVIDFDVIDFKYLFCSLTSELKDEDNTLLYWTTKEKQWDYLIVKPGNTKVSEVISGLKIFLPDHKDDLLLMTIEKSKWSLISSSSMISVKKFILDEKKSYVTNHPRIIKHNHTYKYQKFLTSFNSKMENYSKTCNEPMKILKFARYFMTDYKMMNPGDEIPTIYFFIDKFYYGADEILKVHPDAKDVKFTLYKDIMVDVVNLQKKEQILKNVYWIGTDSYTMDVLLNKFTLTEPQINKFFTDKDGKLVCSDPEILKVFEK